MGSFSNDDGDGNENFKRAIGLLRKQQFYTRITLFCTFLCCHCTTTTWKCLIARFMEDVNKRRRIFLAKKWTREKFAYIWHFHRFEINATKFKETRIHCKSETFSPPSPSSFLTQCPKITESPTTNRYRLSVVSRKWWPQRLVLLRRKLLERALHFRLPELKMLQVVLWSFFEFEGNCCKVLTYVVHFLLLFANCVGLFGNGSHQIYRSKATYDF